MRELLVLFVPGYTVFFVKVWMHVVEEEFRQVFVLTAVLGGCSWCDNPH